MGLAGNSDQGTGGVAGAGRDLLGVIITLVAGVAGGTVVLLLRGPFRDALFGIPFLGDFAEGYLAFGGLLGGAITGFTFGLLVGALAGAIAFVILAGLTGRARQLRYRMGTAEDAAAIQDGLGVGGLLGAVAGAIAGAILNA